MNTKHAVGLSVGNDLDEAIGVTVGFGAAVGREGEFAHLDFTASSRLLLGQADARDLRMCVDDGGDHRMIYDADLPRDVLGDRNSLVHRFVREHKARHDVADRPDARNSGCKAVVHFDLPLLVQAKPGLVESQASGIRPPPDRDQHRVSLDGFSLATRRGLNRNGCGRAVASNRCDLGAELEREPLFGEDIARFPAHFAVEAREDFVEIFDHRHLGAKPLPN